MGEWIVTASVWLALACYPAGPLGSGATTPAGRRRARAFWTLGCVSFVAHVVSSFDVFYAWSHATALRETARQVAELTGWASGAGLYLNYLFTAVWILDVLGWWIDPTRYRLRSRWVVLTFHGFFLFMIFNAAVVFAAGATRVLGLAVTVTGVVGLWRVMRARRGER